VFDHPHRAYVMRKYSGILEAYLTEDFHASSDVLNGFGALECTEWVAAQIGSALRVVHDAGHYHGDVKPANIAIDFNKDDVPGFHLGDFYLAYPPSSEGLPPGPVSIVPKCLSRKCRDADGLRQWDDVAALSLVLYRMLTGKTVDPRRTESLRKHADRLRKLASAKRIANRPGAGRVIEAVLRVFDDGDAFGVAAFVDSLAPRPPDRRRRTKAKILWLAANPAGTNPVELENELGGLEKLLKAAPSRGRIKFTAKHAVDTQDLVDHVSELLPTVVHFSGHGSSEGIVIQHERQGLRVIAGEHLRTFFEDRGVQLVVLNSCFSEPQAKAILPVVRAVVGTAGRLEVGAALLFATSFYRTLANGKPVGEAFRNGCDAVGLGGSPDVFKILGDRDLTIV
jgi:serine/threonine protein kinase